MLNRLESDVADRLLLELSDRETRSVPAELDPDDRAALPDEMSADATKRLMRLLSPEDRAEVRVILGYTEESVGRLMNSDYGSARPDWEMRRDLSEVRSFGRASVNMSVIYVCVSACNEREEAVRVMQRYDQVALPVVDSAKVLIGIATIDDVKGVAEAEVTEDFHPAAAVQPTNRSNRDMGPFRLLRSRIVWLVSLVFVNLASAAVLSAFGDVPAR